MFIVIVHELNLNHDVDMITTFEVLAICLLTIILDVLLMFNGKQDREKKRLHFFEPFYDM